MNKIQEMWVVEYDLVLKQQTDKFKVNYDNYSFEEKLYNFKSGTVNLTNKDNEFLGHIFDNVWNKFDKFNYFIIYENCGWNYNQWYDVYFIEEIVKNDVTGIYSIKCGDMFDKGKNKFSGWEYPVMTENTFINSDRFELAKSVLNLGISKFPTNTDLVAIKTARNYYDLVTTGNEVDYFDVYNTNLSKVIDRLQKHTSTIFQVFYDVENERFKLAITPIEKWQNPIVQNEDGVVRKNTNMRLGKNQYRIIIKQGKIKQTYNYNGNTFEYDKPYNEKYLVNDLTGEISYNTNPPNDLNYNVEFADFTQEEIKQLEAGKTPAQLKIEYKWNLDKLEDNVTLNLDNDRFKLTIGDVIDFQVGDDTITIPIEEIQKSNDNSRIDVVLGKKENGIRKIFNQLRSNND